MRKKVTLNVLAVLVLGSWILSGQGIRDAHPSEPTVRSDRARHTYGTKDGIVLTVGAYEFQPFYPDTVVTGLTNTAARYITSGFPYVEAAVHLPSGAFVYGIELEGCDLSIPGSIDFRLYALSTSSGSETSTTLADFFTPDDQEGGCGYYYGNISFPFTVDNLYTYLLQLTINPQDDSMRFSAVRFYYRLQMSPAPATATFGDVPTDYPYFRAIEALAASGITSGCGGGNFCPNQNITRGELAKFLANALGLHWPH